MICDGCYYFKPYWQDEYGHGCIPAECNHPDCFISITAQTDHGNVVRGEKRVRNILDFVKDGKCTRWAGFYYETKKWWFFSWRGKKVKLLDEGEKNE